MEVHEAMAECATYSAVRSILRILEEKGHIRHEEEGKRYVYLPAGPRQAAAKSASRRSCKPFLAEVLKGCANLFIDGDVTVSKTNWNGFRRSSKAPR